MASAECAHKPNQNTHTHTLLTVTMSDVLNLYIISAQPCRDSVTIEARRKNLPDTDGKKTHCSIDICSAGVVTTPSLLLALITDTSTLCLEAVRL